MPFKVENRLDEKIVLAQEGRIDFSSFLEFLLSETIYVVSASDIGPRGQGLSPLLFNKEGVSMVGEFSSLNKAKKFASKAPYVIPVGCRDFMRGMPMDCGLVVNPSYEYGLDISPEGILRMVSDSG